MVDGSTDTNSHFEPGDFVYQSDQELFLVAMGKTENGHRFAVHGWREISDERLEEYLDGQHGKLYYQDEIEQVIEEEADEDVSRKFESLRRLFEAYADADLPEEGPHDEFDLEDT